MILLWKRWVYLDAIDGVGEGIIGRLASNNADGWGLVVMPSGYLNFYAGSWIADFTISVPVGSWAHVVATRSSGILYYYING